MPISDKTQQISGLIIQQLNGFLGESERQELNDWLALSENNREWHEQVITNKFYLFRKLKEYEEAETIREDGWKKILSKNKPDVTWQTIIRRML